MPKFNRIPATAGPDSSVAKLAREVVRERVQAVVHYWDRAVEREKPRSEDIHQLRVWSRRALAALDLFASQLADDVAAELHRALNKVRKKAGQARDIDVLVATFDKPTKKRLPETLAHISGTRNDVARRIKRSYRKQVSSDKVHDLVDSLARPGDRPAQNGRASLPGEFGPWFGERFLEISAGFRKHLQKTKLTQRSLHPLRIAGKHVRYALEVGLPALPKAAGKQLYEALEQLQTHLGEICDHQALAEELRGLSSALKRKERDLLLELAADHDRLATAGWVTFNQWWQTARGRKKLLQLLSAISAGKSQRRKTQAK